jgi:arylsulfatase
LNFLHVLIGESNEGPREIFYYYFGSGKSNLEGIRYKNWKLVLPHQSASYTALQGKNGFPGEIIQVEIPMALYNLSHDPGEDHDVQKLYHEMVIKLLKIAEEAREDLGDDLTNSKGKNVRMAVTIESP